MRGSSKVLKKRKKCKENEKTTKRDEKMTHDGQSPQSNYDAEGVNMSKRAVARGVLGGARGFDSTGTKARA